MIFLDTAIQYLSIQHIFPSSSSPDIQSVQHAFRNSHWYLPLLRPFWPRRYKFRNSPFQTHFHSNEQLLINLGTKIHSSSLTYLLTENNTDQENRDVNVGPISSDALDASKKLERLILTTGAKQYGVHLGCPKEAHGFGGGGDQTAGSKMTVAPSPNFCYHHQRASRPTKPKKIK